ncbi:MAG TPA: tetratricopeptide repeat protein [Ignavibacteria bacterium]|nr:tetratricopeptide repeat protein [Ignavibacteria bacterium]
MNLKKLIILFFAGIVIAAVSWKVYDYQKNRKNYSPVINENELINLDNIYTTSDKSISTFQEQLNLNPDNTGILLKLGVAYYLKAKETGDPEFISKAENALIKSIEKDPENYIAVTELARVFLSKFNYNKALETSLKAIEINPYSTYPYGVLSEVQIKLGMYDKASETLQKLSDTRKNPVYFSGVSELKNIKGDTRSAIDEMRSAVSAGLPTAENTAWNRFRLGMLFYNSGDPKTAEEIFGFLIKDFPEYGQGYFAMGKIKLHKKEYPESIELFTKAVDILPIPEFLISLGDAYLLSGDNKSSDEIYLKAKSVIEKYKQYGYDTDIEFSDFYADRNYQLQETLEKIRKIHDAGNQSIELYNSFAWLCYKLDNNIEALKNIDSALSTGIKDPLIFFHAGKIFEKAGQIEKSKEYLDFALKINPYYEILYSK